MNQADLLDQFVIEARECLETIGQRLLQVERDPGNDELLNDLFRSVHTLKGNCGLFEFKPLEMVVHAGEDLLDRVRNRTLAYGEAMADALLEAMDYSAQLIDQIERHGRIDEAAARRSAPLAAALRLLLQGQPAGAATMAADGARDAQGPATAPATGSAGAAVAHPAWTAALADEAAVAGDCVAVRYQPEPECFFKGEDPWRLALTTPGLLHVVTNTAQAWPDDASLDGWDCYRCNLVLTLLSSAPLADVHEHFRCVPEQVECVAMTTAATAASAVAAALVAAPIAAPIAAPASVATPAQSLLRSRASAMWADQIALLTRPAVDAGTLRSVERSLHGLLCAWPEAAAAAAVELQELPPGAAPLLAWARAQRAQGNAASPAAASQVGAATGGSDEPPPVNNRYAPAGGGDDGAGAHSRVLKVGQEKIDRLMDLIGEMVVAKNSLPYLAQRAENVFGQRELAREIKAQYAVVNRIAEDLQHAIMQVRMLPVGAVFQRFGRLVRDISKKLGKDVQMVVEGEDTEADKNIIEPLADPLIHILRNSLDHGIELPDVRRALGKPAQGTIRIRARQEGDRVIIEIGDDGAGVDPARVRAKAVERGLVPADRAATLSDDDAVQLIFLPGFSTADSVSDLSGRGVGMDVVRNAVERINGGVVLASRKGHGTTITLSLPLSMAVTQVMVVECAGRRFGLPMDLISETVRVHGDDIHHFKNARTTVLRGRIVPLKPLAEALALEAEPLRNGDGEYAVLVLRVASGTVGLLVDQFHGASDIILKPLEGVLAGLTGFAGTALMGDGSVLMVINPKELL